MRALIALALLLTSPLLAANMIANPGFEAPAVEGLAQGWLNNTWGETTSTFSLDPVRPHSGQTSQRIEAVRGASGAAQFLWPLKVEARKRYHVQLWVRAEGEVARVGACLRQKAAPYQHYLQGGIEPTADWQLLEFEGFASGSEDEAGLYVFFEPAPRGTVWVDDALVEIIDPTAVRGPAPTGNVVPNGSFELDTARTWDGVGKPVETVEGSAAHGRRSLHASLKAGEDFRLTTPCLPFYGNNLPFTLACSARATGAVALRLVLRSADQIAQPEEILKLTLTPTAEFARQSVSGLVPCSYAGAYYLTVEGSSEQGGELWLDAVSLSPAGEAFLPAAPLEVALAAAPLANVFAPGEAPRVQVGALSTVTGVARLRLEVRDYTEAPGLSGPRRDLREGRRAGHDVGAPAGLATGRVPRGRLRPGRARPPGLAGLLRHPAAVGHPPRPGR